jgi:hypothetical protein
MTLSQAQLNTRAAAVLEMQSAASAAFRRKIEGEGINAHLRRLAAEKENGLGNTIRWLESSEPITPVNDDISSSPALAQPEPASSPVATEASLLHLIDHEAFERQETEPERRLYSAADGWAQFRWEFEEVEPGLFAPATVKRISNNVQSNPVHAMQQDLGQRLRQTIYNFDAAASAAIWATPQIVSKATYHVTNTTVSITRNAAGALADASTKGTVALAGAAGAASITIAIGASAFHGHAGKPAPEAHYVVDARPSAVPNVVFEAPAAAALPDGVLQSSDALITAPARQELTQAEKSSGYHKVAMIAIDAALKSNLFPVMAQAAQETHTTVANILAMINIESNVNLKASNGKSTSQGPLQIVDETFIGMVSNHWNELKQPLTEILTEHPSLVSMLEKVRISAQKAQHHAPDGRVHLDAVAREYAQTWHQLSHEELAQAKLEGLTGNLLRDTKIARQNPAVSVFFAFKQIQHEYTTLPKNVQNRLGTNGAIRCLIFLGRGQTIAVANAPGHKHINYVLRHAVLKANNIPKTLTVDQLIDRIRAPYVGQVEAIQAALKSSARPELRSYSMAFNANVAGQSSPRPSAG